MTSLTIIAAFAVWSVLAQMARNRAQSRRYEHMCNRLIEMERR